MFTLTLILNKRQRSTPTQHSMDIFFHHLSVRMERQIQIATHQIKVSYTMKLSPTDQ